MSACESHHANLTALADGELSFLSTVVLRAHLLRCPACAEAARAVEASADRQRQLFARVDPNIDGAALLAGVRTSIDALGAPVLAVAPVTVGRRLPWQAPALAFGVALLAVVGLTRYDAVSVPLGIESPPPAIAADAELFYDYAIIQQLDALENFDRVNEVPLDDDRAQAAVRWVS